MKTIEFLASTMVQTSNTPGGEWAKVILAYAVLILLFLFGLVILYKIIRGTIDINLLLQESGGGASMSRFQLLIFTFVIGFSFFLIVLCDCKFPDVNGGVLALLGISASTYGVSKGIQAGGGLDPKGGKPTGDGKPQTP